MGSNKATDLKMNFKYPLHSEIEAQVLASALEEQGIPHVVQSFADSAYDGIFQTQKGWGRILAPDTYQATILQILNDLRSGNVTWLEEDGNMRE